MVSQRSYGPVKYEQATNNISPGLSVFQMKIAVFVDRDGTIAQDVPYCSNPNDFELFPGVPEAVRKLNDEGILVVVVTNQSGIGRGYFQVDVLNRIHTKMYRELANCGARLDGVYYCPHLPEDKCNCRKPRTALFQQAAIDHSIDCSRSYVIGNAASDLVAGRTMGCHTVLVRSSKIAGDTPAGLADFVASDFSQAVTWITAREHKKNDC